MIARGGDLTKMQLRSVGPTLSATSPMALGPMHANPDRFVNVIFYTVRVKLLIDVATTFRATWPNVCLLFLIRSRTCRAFEAPSEF